MAKANITLANGTVVAIDGTVDEIRALLEIYSHGAQPSIETGGKIEKSHRRKTKSKRSSGETKVKKGPKDIFQN